MLISIIIPVYNVEKYLTRCLNSVIQNQGENIEVILINDGSTDNSLNICKRYTNKNKFIRLINKENQGLSATRNLGISIARGKYILFLDSDDELEANSLIKIEKIIDNYDVDLISVNLVKLLNGLTKKQLYSLRDNNIYKGVDFYNFENKSNSMFIAAVRFIYNREFLLNNNLLFKENIVHEDEEFIPRVLYVAEKVLATNIVHYKHHLREDSITGRADKRQNAKSLIFISLSLSEEFKNISNKRFRKNLYDHLVSINLKIYIDAQKNNQKIETVSKNFLLKHSYSMKNKMRALMYCANKRLFFHFSILLQKLIKKTDIWAKAYESEI